jgi:ribosomal protein S12 methylthiotransferase
VAGRFHLVTLGCPKNVVDSEKIAAALGSDGMLATDDLVHADLVVVNTCAFIDEARQESIDTILALADARRAGAKLVVTGCLAERYGDDLADALPEADAVVGFAGAGTIAEVAFRGRRRAPSGVRDLLELPRVAPSAPWAYLKVAEGCDRACAFCAIPSFRGKQRSRTPDAVVAEARDLVTRGVRELVLVAQDLAWYGRDVGEVGALAPLLRRLDRELAGSGLARVRLLYLYPSEVKDPLVATMLELETVVPYFDLSLQHAARGLLARMARWGSGAVFLDAIARIRAQAPDAAFRSSFIVGFPGETEHDHEVLHEFLDAAALDWAGFFPFSAEEGTPAAVLGDRVPAALVAERIRECEERQTALTQAARDALCADATPLEVLVDSVGDTAATGRTHREAPEIDGVVHIERVGADPLPREGTIVQAVATGALGPDLFAREVAAAQGVR